jgi:hypothetical protein
VTARIAYVYALLDPATGKPRYIGHSRDVPARVKAHWWDRCKNSRVATNPRFFGWLRSLGGPPTYRIVAAVPWERRFQLERLFTERARQAPGADLLNINSGNRKTAEELAAFTAQGHAAWQAAARARRAAKTQEPAKPKVRKLPGPMPAERRAKISKARLGWNPSAETRARMSAGQKARFARNPRSVYREERDEQLLVAAAEMFGTAPPSLRVLQCTFGIGQSRAQRIQRRLKAA